MAHSELYVGDISTPLFYFQDSDLTRANGALSVDLMGNKLTQDEMEVTSLWDKVGANIEVFAPSDFDAILDADILFFATSYTGTENLLDIPYGTPCWYYFDGVLIGKFYTKRIVRTGANNYQFTLMSCIGLLSNLLDYGGIYSPADGDTFLTVLAAILGGSVGALSNGLYPITGGVFDCFVEQSVGVLPIAGWLPIATKRENLHQLMFSEGISLTKAADGTPVFSYIYNEQTPSTLADADVYLGGRINYESPATAIEVTEHTFLDLGVNDELVTLFDGTAEGSVTNATVQFDEPCHDLIATNVTISTSGANYAVITGSGTLQGYKYTHSQKILRTVNTAALGETNEVSISNVTLVNPLNSLNVAARALEYYSSAQSVDADVRISANGDPKCGRQYAFTDPFGESETGFVTNIDFTASNILKVNAHIVTDYVPTGQGNAYSNAVLLTAGNWTIPTGVTEARFILVGGGQGGTNGADGASGTNPIWIDYYTIPDTSAAIGGSGGQGGVGGSAGKVFTVDKNGLVGGSTVTITYGTGGVNGSNGTATTISVNGDTHSSEDGSVPAYGIINLFTGDVYALAGQNGIDGGKGGDFQSAGENVTANGITHYGGDAGTYSFNYSRQTDYYGGGGGGASADNDGMSGHPVSYDDYSIGEGFGGNGLAATCSYGSGSNGGNGGGGGGAGGYSRQYSLGHYMYQVGGAATGGSGGVAVSGGDGCVLIYY